MIRKLTFGRLFHGFSTDDLHRSKLTDHIPVPEYPCKFDCIVLRRVNSHEQRIEICAHSHLSPDSLRTIYTTPCWNVEEIFNVSSVKFSSES